MKKVVLLAGSWKIRGHASWRGWTNKIDHQRSMKLAFGLIGVMRDVSLRLLWFRIRSHMSPFNVRSPDVPYVLPTYTSTITLLQRLQRRRGRRPLSSVKVCAPSYLFLLLALGWGNFFCNWILFFLYDISISSSSSNLMNHSPLVPQDLVVWQKEEDMNPLAADDVLLPAVARGLWYLFLRYMFTENAGWVIVIWGDMQCRFGMG